MLLVLLSVTAAAVALVGPFGRWVTDVSSIGSGPLHLWTWVKWPLLVVLGLLLFTLLYKFTPSRRQPALWWLLPGAAVGVALWIAASAGFSLYLDHFSSYNRVYGTLGAAVAFLVWAWLMNLAPPRRRGGQPRGGTAAKRRPGKSRAAPRMPPAYNRASRQPARPPPAANDHR